MFGDGSQTRSFCYVSDLVDGIIRLMRADVHEPVNLGNPHEITVREVRGPYSGALRVATVRLCSGRCRKTIRCAGNRTSRARGRCSGGDLRMH